MIAEDASPNLAKLRQTARRLEHDIRGTLEGLIRNKRIRDLLQDQYYTTREGRFVLPVKADFQGRIEGIVHDTSSRGATVFIEPRAIADLGNSLKVAQGKVREEEERILRELSDDLRQNLNLINEAWEGIIMLDLIQAKAFFGKRFEGTTPILKEKGELSLINVRHPLLEADPEVEVVPNSIQFDVGARALIITGPNAGGKTVALKTTGVAVLSAKAGLPVLAESKSVIPWFEDLFANIGDWQSLTAHLSTFSAQIRGMVEIYNQAREGSLVLLDEVVSATDPHEGAALAKALSEALVNQGAILMVTTHYGELKTMAYEDQRFRNSAMEFREDTLSPTYRLIPGVPGKSNATEIARRLGLVDSIIYRAKELLGTRAASETALLADLQKKNQEADKELRDAKILKTRAKEEEQVWRSELERFRKEKQQLLFQAQKEFEEKIKEKEQELHAAITELQKKPTLQEAEVIRRRLGEIKRTAPKAPKIEAPRKFEPISDWETVYSGKQIWVESLGTRATLLSIPDAKGLVEIQIGAIRTRVPMDKISEVTETTPKTGAVSIEAEALVETTLNLHGQHIEDAIPALDQFLNRAAAAGHIQVVVVHGHGTGALRNAIREYLTASPLVESYRPGEPHEGGNGVTVIELS